MRPPDSRRATAPGGGAEGGAHPTRNGSKAQPNTSDGELRTTLIPKVTPWDWRAHFLQDAPPDPLLRLVGLVGSTFADVDTGENVRPGMTLWLKATGIRDRRTIWDRQTRLEELGWFMRTHHGGSAKGGRRMARTWRLTLPRPVASDAPGHVGGPVASGAGTSDTPCTTSDTGCATTQPLTQPATPRRLIAAESKDLASARLPEVRSKLQQRRAS